MNANTMPLGSREAPTSAEIDRHEATRSPSICWGAVLAGAAGAASLTLILLMLGVGLGLSSVSPWSFEGVSAETFGAWTIVWLAFTQLAASGLGGYLAGRLRQRWTRVHTDEVYFRDTAHGFLAWSVATLATAGLLTSAVASLVGGGAKAGAGLAGTAVASAAVAASGTSGGSAAGTSPDYFVDLLLRPAEPGPAVGAAPPATGPEGSASAETLGPRGATVTSPLPMAPDAPSRAELVRIFANAAAAGSLPPDDRRYLGQLVAQRKGLSQQEAEQQVAQAFIRLQGNVAAAKEQARQLAEQARRASTKAALWGFISLLIGAFVASLLGTLGGRHRDQF